MSISLVFPGMSMGVSNNNILEDILIDVLKGVANPNGGGSILGDSILGDSSYEGVLYDQGSGITLRYKIFTSSRNDGKSQNPDEYDLNEVDLSETLYVEEDVAKVFFRLDLINPREKVIRIRRDYGSVGKGDRARPKTSRKDSIAGNMENTRVYIPITPGKSRLAYRNEILLSVSVDGFEVFRVGPFTAIKE